MAYPIFTMDSMLKQNGGPVTLSSMFINISELKPGVVDAIRNTCVLAAVSKAVDLWGRNQPLTIRDIVPLDMAYATNEFTEISGGAAAWNIMAFGPFTVPTATVIGIYGLKLSAIMDATMQLLPITAVRIDVGGSRHAQWDVETLNVTLDSAGVATTYPLGGVTKSPIIVAEDITVTISEYCRTAYNGTVYYPVWLGVCVEKQGVTLMAQSSFALEGGGLQIPLPENLICSQRAIKLRRKYEKSSQWALR